MNFSLTLFKTALLSRLIGWRAWTLLLLLPLITFGARALLPAEEVSTPVQVGVVLPEEGGEAFWQRLAARSGLAVTFCPASRAQAERQVAAGRWDCALILPPDFEQRLERLELEGLFTLLTGSGSTVYPMVREPVFACVAELIAPGMAEEYLLDSGIAEREGLDRIRPRLHEQLREQDRVLISAETLDGRPLSPLTLADSGVSNLLSGLTAILLLIWALLTAMDLGRWLDAPFARRLAPLQSRMSLLLPRLEAALLPAFCAGALALLAAKTPLPCILALIPYLLFWGAAALALACLPPVWQALPALLPFVPAAGLLLSPVLLDLSLLFPALGPVIRCLPVTLYLRACGGSLADGLLLAAGGAAILAVLLAADKKRA